MTSATMASAPGDARAQPARAAGMQLKRENVKVSDGL
jgi:hypothetical protein